MSVIFVPQVLSLSCGILKSPAPYEQRGTYWSAHDGKSWFAVCEEHGNCYGEICIDGDVFSAFYEFNTHEDILDVTAYVDKNINLSCTQAYTDESYKMYFGDCVFKKDKFIAEIETDSNKIIKYEFTKNNIKEQFYCVDGKRR